MASLPYMPFFVAEYLLDAGHLSEEEHGAYLRLLTLAWASPECRIPNDDAWLARRLCRPLEIIQRLYRPIIAEFWKTDGNWLFQKRQRAEWHRCRGKSAQQSDNAKSRWKKEKGISGGNADAMPSHSHSHLEEEKESSPVGEPKKEPDPPPLDPEPAAPAASPPPPPPPPKVKPVKTSRGTRLPPDWTPGPDGIAYAVGVGLTVAQAEDQAERMRNWSKNAQGSNGVKLDWFAFWRNWCRRAADDIAARPNNHGPPPERGIMAQGQRVLDRIRASGHGREDTSGADEAKVVGLPLLRQGTGRFG